jgi:hypothetical protein
VDLQLCPRVYPDDRYAANAGLTLAEKTSLLAGLWRLRSLPGIAASISSVLVR